MKLNGWQRLWVFFSLLYLGAMALFTFLTMPGEYSVTHSTELYERMSQASVERLLRDSEAKTISRVEMPNGHSIPFPSDMPEPEMTAVTKEYSDLLAREGRKKRLRYLAGALAWWVVPCVLLYLIGYGVAWVRRGFPANR